MALPARRWLLGVALLVAGAVALDAPRYLRHPDPAPSPAPSAGQPPPPPAAGPAELALVAPLVPGGGLAGFTVREIRGVERGLLRVVCARDRAVVRLDVALVDPEGALPPATAGRFAVYYSLRGAAPEDGDLLARRLAKILEANASVPPPPGMTTFTPDPTPGTAL